MDFNESIGDGAALGLVQDEILDSMAEPARALPVVSFTKFLLLIFI
jgi:hypothetical protein